jgi:hypothetical protein
VAGVAVLGRRSGSAGFDFHANETEHGDEKETWTGLALALGVLLWATG